MEDVGHQPHLHYGRTWTAVLLSLVVPAICIGVIISGCRGPSDAETGGTKTACPTSSTPSAPPPADCPPAAAPARARVATPPRRAAGSAGLSVSVTPYVPTTSAITAPTNEPPSAGAPRSAESYREAAPPSTAPPLPDYWKGTPWDRDGYVAPGDRPKPRTPHEFTRAWDQVKLGMTRDQVFGLLGPGYFVRGSARWQEYRWAVREAGPTHADVFNPRTYVVMFEDGQLFYKDQRPWRRGDPEFEPSTRTGASSRRGTTHSRSRR